MSAATSTTARQAIKNKLAAREPVAIVAPDYPSPGLCEFLALQGFDVVFIDCEHGGPDIERVVDMARAIRAAGSVSLLRPWSRDPGLIRRYTECRVDGFLLPGVETASDVAEAVAAMSEATMSDPASLLMIPLIESTGGAGNLRDILAVPGVDGMTVGPSDLALSMGFLRGSDDPAVRDATLAAISTARDLGKSAGGPVNRYGEQTFHDAGGNILAFTVNLLIRRGMSASHPLVSGLSRRG